MAKKVNKQDRRDTPFTARESSNNISKRKKIMRKLKITSKGDYLVEATDRLYEALNLAPHNSNAELDNMFDKPIEQLDNLIGGKL